MSFKIKAMLNVYGKHVYNNISSNITGIFHQSSSNEATKTNVDPPSVAAHSEDTRRDGGKFRLFTSSAVGFSQCVVHS